MIERLIKQVLDAIAFQPLFYKYLNPPTPDHASKVANQI
jgi:hypothetical protein